MCISSCSCVLRCQLCFKGSSLVGITWWVLGIGGSMWVDLDGCHVSMICIVRLEWVSIGGTGVSGCGMVGCMWEGSSVTGNDCKMQ